MNKALRKFGPSCTVLAAIVWLCWPENESLNHLLGDQGGQQVAGIEPTQLKPELPPPSDRNPFRPLGEDRKPPPARVSTAASRKLSVTLVEPAELVASLELQGTFISGKGKSAFINDQLCFEGERIPLEVEPTVLCRVTRVLPNAVWVEIDGHAWRLEYPDLAARQSPDKDTGSTPMDRADAAVVRPPPLQTAGGLLPLLQQLRAVVVESLGQPTRGSQRGSSQLELNNPAEPIKTAD